MVTLKPEEYKFLYFLVVFYVKTLSFDFFFCVCYNIVITHDFLCCRKSHALREREREKKEKISMNFAEEKKKFPYYHHSELVMYSVITHVLSNNVKSTQRQASAK